MRDPGPGTASLLVWRVIIAGLFLIYGQIVTAFPFSLLVPALFLLLDVIASHRAEEYGGTGRFIRLRMSAIIVTLVLPLLINPGRFWQAGAQCDHDAGCLFRAMRDLFPQ